MTYDLSKIWVAFITLKIRMSIINTEDLSGLTSKPGLDAQDKDLNIRQSVFN